MAGISSFTTSRIAFGLLAMLSAQSSVCSADAMHDIVTGRNALVAGEPDVAIRLLSTALNEGLSEDNIAVAHNLRGLALLDKNLPEKAIPDFNEALRLQPNSDSAFSNRGNAYVRMRLLKKAIKDYDDAIRLNPNCINAYIGRGRVNVYLGLYTSAFADFDKVLQIDPNNLLVQINRGYGHFRMGQYSVAISDYDNVLRLKPDDPDALAWRGRSFYLLGNFQAAAEDFAHAHKASEDDLYSLSWEFLAKERGGLDWHSDFLQAVQDSHNREWPRPILDFLAGQLSSIQLISISNKGNTSLKLAHKCEDWTYMGEVELIHAKQLAAIALFHRANDVCPDTFVEVDVAKAELSRLSKHVDSADHKLP